MGSAGRDRGMLRIAGVRDIDDAVAPARLRLVDGDVGCVQEALRVDRVARVARDAIHIVAESGSSTVSSSKRAASTARRIRSAISHACSGVQSVADQVGVVDTVWNQAAPLKTGWPVASVPMNASRFVCGFGGLTTAAAAPALTSPTPAAWPLTSGSAVAVLIRAPFTWSDVQLGWRASTCAAAPATIGAASEVPAVHM